MESKVARRNGGRLTIYDVARLAGVSRMTVSRVINGEPSVTEAKRIRVAEAIRELDYAPNHAARSLASARTLQIGLLYSNPSPSYLSELLLGALEQCGAKAIQLIVVKCGVEAGEEVAVRRLIATGVGGVILPSPLCDSAEIVRLFRDADIPIVTLGTDQPPAATSSIRVDDYAAAHAMTTHLIGLGHRRIGYISGHPRQTASSQRLEGYTAALRDGGITPDPALVVQGYFTYHSGLEGADVLLALANRPTAIFAANDDMGAAAIAVAHRLGLDVPRDLTICGFDDTALATTVWPPMTTVRQPVADMARDAVTLLADAVNRKADGKPAQALCEMAPFTLVYRQSDGPPATPRSRHLAKTRSTKSH